MRGNKLQYDLREFGPGGGGTDFNHRVTQLCRYLKATLESGKMSRMTHEGGDVSVDLKAQWA